MDWKGLFLPTHSLLEIVVRGSFMYLLLFVVLRFVLKRQTGAIGIADLLVIVLIADAAQNGMAGEYSSVTEGAVLVFTIVFWNYALDRLGFWFPALERFVRPAPLLLVRDGRLQTRNMAHESITEAELMSQLRQQGIEDPAQVRRAFIEGDGRMSVIRREPDG